MDVDVLANDSDPDAANGDMLEVVGFSQGSQGTVNPVNGAVRNGVASFALRYTPNPGFSGTDGFTYVIMDSKGATASATVQITVVAVNDPPQAVNDVAITDEDMAVIIAVLGNDSDPDGDSLTVSAVSDGHHGTVASQNDGTLRYTPEKDYNGEDNFTYTVDDGNGGSASANVRVTVLPVEDLPESVPDATILDPDLRASAAESVIIDPLRNDVNKDSKPLQIRSVGQAQQGTVVLNSDNTLTYTRVPGFTGTDRFNYIFGPADNPDMRQSGAVSVIVDPDDSILSAADDIVQTTEDASVTIAVLANDVSTGGVPQVLGVSPQNGVVVINPDGTVTYTPNRNFNGVDTFTYIAGDGNLGAAQATVTVNVSPVNDRPVPSQDSATTPEEVAFTLNLLQNDSDPDGDTLTISSLTQPTRGTLHNNGDGTVRYTPALDANGSDSFAYNVTDGNGGNATALVEITITPVNDEPLAAADLVVLDEDSSTVISVLLNDRDPDGDPLTVTAVEGAALGTVRIQPDGTLDYKPLSNANGNDSFSYTVSDGTLTSSASVGIKIRAQDETLYLPVTIK